MSSSRNEVLGVGLQLNTELSPMLPQLEAAGITWDYAEILCDMFAAPLDGPHVFDPRLEGTLDELSSKFPLLAHSNYGEEFGFEPLEQTQAALRHLPVTQRIKSPFVADHMFYGNRAAAYIWSSPLQFSKQEIERVAGRAAALQDLLKIPLAHENAFYYAPFPGSNISEAEFIAGVVEKAQTHLLVDLHNLHANSMNFEGYDPYHFLRTIPVDRVLEIHIAGGQHLEDWYHDLHNNAVPDAVWQMLRWLLERGKNIRAVTLEVQGPAHTSRSRPMDDTWPTMIKADLDRAKAIWNEVRGAAVTP